MKILYLEHPQFDLGAFNLYNGLCEILGPDNIVVFPRKQIYYGQLDNHQGDYLKFLWNCITTQPLPAGMPPLSPNEHLINGWPNATDRPYYVTQPDQPTLSEHDVVERLRGGSFDFIVLASSNRVNTYQLVRFRDYLGGNLPPVVYVDNGERDELNEHWAHVFHPKVIFKLILTPAVYNYIKNKYGWELHSLPQSSCLGGKDVKEALRKFEGNFPEYVTFSDTDKPIDVFFAMGSTYDKRQQLGETVAAYIKKSAYSGLSKASRGFSGYLNCIAHSRIAVSMRGSGRDTSRYWDIPLFETLMMCDGTMGCMHPNPFEHEKTAVFYDEEYLEQVPTLLQYYLDNEKDRKRIARDGRAHLLKYHTNRARAQYFLDITTKELRQ